MILSYKSCLLLGDPRLPGLVMVTKVKGAAKLQTPELNESLG